jgi:hypothetical protein
MSNFLLQEWGWGVREGGGGRKMVMKKKQKEKEIKGS